MPTVKMGTGHRVQLPGEVARRLKLRTGTQLEVVVSGDVVVLVPKGRIPKGQEYFWTQEWQSKEHEADEAIARGDVLGPFSDAEAAIEALRTHEV